jgi:hypothetical protein
MKILIEKHREFSMETHIAFVDFKKAFNQVNRKELLRILASDQVPQQTIQNIYNVICVRFPWLNSVSAVVTMA